MSPSPSYQFFTLTHPAPHIAHVEINRPEKLNAFYAPMFPELQSVFEHLAADRDVRCILFSGKGDKAFCAGLDLTAALAPGSPLAPPASGSPPPDPSRLAHHLRTHILSLQTTLTTLSRTPQPIIALLHGPVYGLGIDLAVACDLRLCTADARFSVKEVDIGIAADLGTLTRLPRVVGQEGWCREVAYTGREWGTGEARGVGFVNAVVGEGMGMGQGKREGKEELVRAGLEMAGRIAEKSPVAVQATKEILEARGRGAEEEHLRYTAVVNSSVLQGADVHKAIEGLVQKRRVRFEKL